MNESSNDFVMEHSTSELIELAYQIAFFCIGTPINLFALVRTGKTYREGGVESRLIRLSRQLLIAHLMVLFMYGVWRSYWFYNIVWVQGDLMCRVYSFLCALPFHLWSNMVAAIAADMLFCITSPLISYRTGASRVTWLIALAWGCAIACASPMLFFRGTIEITGTNYSQCYPRTDIFDDKVLIMFNFFHVVTTFYIPLMIIVICYSIIGFSIRKQMAERELLQDGGLGPKTSNTKRRFLRATVGIIATFFLSWLPYQALALLRVFCDGDSCQDTMSKLNWLQAIIVASTCINPFLYQFGGEKKQTSHHCSTMNTAGKEGQSLYGGRRLFRRPIPSGSTIETVQTDTNHSPAVRRQQVYAHQNLPYKNESLVNYTTPRVNMFDFGRLPFNFTFNFPRLRH